MAQHKLVPLLMGLVMALLIEATPAQVTTGTILGTVRDETDAILPGATVTIKNLDTGISRTAVTDEQGRYQATHLSLGNYEVSASLGGFQSVIRSGIQLTVGRTAVVDFVLKVGEITERIVVTGEASLVETTNAAIAGLTEGRQISDLPLNGRNFMQLTTLQQGVHVARTGQQSQTRGLGVRISVGGARPKQNTFLLDGTELNDTAGETPASAAGISLGVDAIREFKVINNTYSAEFGGRAGGVISVVSKSGTNEIHGTAFYFHRNDNLDARNFFDPDQDPPEFKRNQFGFSLGGPVRRDKTFFFTNYEGLRERLGLSLVSTVPTAAAREGRPPNRTVNVNPAVRPYLKFYPLPNGRDFGDGTAEHVRGASRDTDEDFFVVKIDHNFSDRDSLFVRYSFDDGIRSDPNDDLGNIVEGLLNRYQYVTIEEKRIFSPALLNTFRFAYNRTKTDDTPLPLVQIDPSLAFIPGRPVGGIRVVGLTDLDLGGGGVIPRKFIFQLFQFTDDLNYTKGRHSLKFGLDIKRALNAYEQPIRPGGRIDFNTLEDFLTARTRRVEAMTPQSVSQRDYRQTMFAWYIQDDIKLTPRLTLNLGVRHEFITVPREVHGRQSALRNIFPADDEVTIGPLFTNPSKENLAPRLGLAWDPTGSGKTAIRAGFGLFYDQLWTQYYLLPGALNRPFMESVVFNRPAFPDIFRGFSLDRIPPGARRVDSIEFQAKQPYRFQYSLSVQRELASGIVLNATYVGAQSVHNSRNLDSANQALPVRLSDGRLFFPEGSRRRNPNWGPFRHRALDGMSFYHSFQLGVRKRLSQGLQFQAAYTLGKSVDDSSALFNTNEFENTQDIPNPDDRKSDRGLSDFDVRHNFVFNFTYDLPGKNLAGAAGKVLGGWQINGILNLSSGSPFSPVLGFDNARALTFRAGGGQRPILLPGKSNNPVLGGPDRYFDPTVFALPEPGFFGNLGRNTVIAPGVAQADISLFKSNFIKLGGRDDINIQFRAEFFNIFNRANFGLPQREVFSSRRQLIGNVGRITTTTTTSREVQFGLKFIF